jgi:hypothetical protein
VKRQEESRVYHSLLCFFISWWVLLLTLSTLLYLSHSTFYSPTPFYVMTCHMIERQNFSNHYLFLPTPTLPWNYVTQRWPWNTCWDFFTIEELFLKKIFKLSFSFKKQDDKKHTHKPLFVKCLQMMKRNAYQYTHTCMHMSERPHVCVTHRNQYEPLWWGEQQKTKENVRNPEWISIFFKVFFLPFPPD